MSQSPTHLLKRKVFHSFSERKRVVELYLAGHSSKRIAKMLNLDDSMVRAWLRKYRTYGMEALRPYWRGRGREEGIRVSRHNENERTFQPAFTAYAKTLEPVSSITRRYKIDYHSFKYHVERYHPELVEQRKRLLFTFEDEVQGF